MLPHLIWDWNGTLFDDRALLFNAMAQAMREEGFSPASAERMRDEFTRPMKAFFERLVRRPLSPNEWSLLDRTFQRIYRRLLAQGSLVPGTREALVGWRDRGGHQSLVSLWRHDDLTRIVRRHRLTDLFDEVVGRPEEHQRKVRMLLELLYRHSFHPDQVVLIGDAREDVTAADEAGIRMVLVVGASLERIDAHDYATRGVPVACSLAQAIALVRPLASAASNGPGLF